MKEIINYEYLKNNGLILFEYVCGSTAYGTNIESSDIDVKYVYVLPQDYLLGLDSYYVDQINDDNNNKVGMELKKYLGLLRLGNPNTIESLNIPSDCVLSCHPLFQSNVLDKRKLFLSKMCKDSFSGYAHGQIKKARGLNKKIVNPIPKEKKDLLDFCYVIDNDLTYPFKKLLADRNLNQLYCGIQKVDHAQDIYAVYYDRMAERNFIDDSPETLRHREANKSDGNIMGYGFKGLVNPRDPDDTNQLRLSSIPKITDANKDCVEYLCLVSYNAGNYSKYCKEYRSYHDWLNNRNEVRYTENSTNGSDFDCKNMMHNVRLLHMCLDFFTKNEIVVRRPDREFLLDIRNHKYSYDYLIDYSDKILAEVEEAVKLSSLPDTVDLDVVNDLLISIRKDFYIGKSNEN